MNKVETYNRKNILSQIKWLIKMVRHLLKNTNGGGEGIQSIQAGNNITVDSTDPQNPIVSSTGGSGDTNIIESISRNGNPITPDGSKNVDIPIFSTSGAGLVPARVGSATTKYLREDGTWVTPTNTTYSAMNLTELNTGTATTARTTSAKVLTDWLNGKISTVGFSGSYNDLDNKPQPAKFIEVTEEGKTGYRLSKQLETPTHFGSIGDYAIDLTQNGTTVGSYGATGTGSVAMGIMMTASGDYTAVIGGGLNSANSLYSSVFGGYNNHAEQSNATVIGGVDNYASGNGSLVGGMGNTAGSMSEVVFGRYSTFAGGNATSVVATDRLFNIGNGSSSARSDALTILKNGLATLPSVTNTLIDAEPTGKAVVTKEWVNDFYKTIPGYDEEATQILKHVNGVLQWVTDK